MDIILSPNLDHLDKVGFFAVKFLFPLCPFFLEIGECTQSTLESRVTFDLL